MKGSAKCRKCGCTVRTAKFKGVLTFAAHDYEGGFCQGSGERVNLPVTS